jgi:hypothetical protein
MIFVMGPFSDPGDESFPYARSVFTVFELMAFLVPAVEISHDGDPFGIRGPDGKTGPHSGIGSDYVRTQFLIQFYVVALLEDIDVIIRNDAHVISHPLAFVFFPFGH